MCISRFVCATGEAVCLIHVIISFLLSRLTTSKYDCAIEQSIFKFPLKAKRNYCVLSGLLNICSETEKVIISNALMERPKQSGACSSQFVGVWLPHGLFVLRFFKWPNIINAWHAALQLNMWGPSLGTNTHWKIHTFHHPQTSSSWFLPFHFTDFVTDVLMLFKVPLERQSVVWCAAKQKFTEWLCLILLYVTLEGVGGRGGWWLREILKEDAVGDFQSGQLVSAEVGEGGDYSSRAVAAETRVLWRLELQSMCGASGAKSHGIVTLDCIWLKDVLRLIWPHCTCQQ